MIFIFRNFHILSISPIFPMTLGLILGITWQAIMSFTFFPLISSFITIFLMIVKIIKPIPFKPSHASILFCITLTAGSFLYQNQLNKHEKFYAQTENQSIDITGTIIDISSNNHPTMQTTITLQTNSIKKNSAMVWEPLNKTILIYTNRCDKKLWVKDVITLTKIECKKPQDYSFNQYLIKQGIAATFFIDKLSYSLEHRPFWSLNRLIFNKRCYLFKKIQKKMSAKTFTFFSSLFLGNKTTQKINIQSMNEQFKKWGISHLLARSGMHLTIFIFTWQILLCFLPFSFIFKQCLLLTLSSIYFIFSWPSISFIRAFSIFILYQLCNVAKKPAHFLHLLLLTCFSFLVLNPMQLFFLDFQLSFSLTFALAWFNQLYQTKQA